MWYSGAVLARHLTPALLASLGDSPVTLLVGARQTGKSTLVQSLAGGRHPAEYLTFDDAAVLAAASTDPAGFVAGLRGPVVLDEVQHVPGLFPALKATVDRDRRPGRFLLTGSADVLLLPKVSESLAGRMEAHTLWPLSQGEIDGVRESFLGRLFEHDLPGAPRRESSGDVIPRALRGGYPPAVQRAPGSRRESWLRSYVSAVLLRDVRDLANVQRLHELPRLLALLAARAAAVVNVADLGRSLGIPQTSLQRYLTLLEHVFLVVRIPAWYSNLGQRVIKAPKLLVNDTALMAHVLGLSEERLRREPTLVGALLENFVGMELVKQASWHDRPPDVFHFRTTKGLEVDFVLEDSLGRIAGVEVKAAASVGARDFNGLRALAERAGERFVRGIVLYRGEAAVPFSERLQAWPVENLWAR